MRPKLVLMVFILAGVATATAAFALSTCNDSDDGSGGGAPSDYRVLELAPIDELELIIRESAPPQYAVRIVSGLPSGCAQFHDAALVARQGETFGVRVRNSMPSDPNLACTAIYGMHESVVELGSDLVSGTEYSVKVNDRETTFTAQ